tara:strand:- start:71 stop:265 length:195 start_codon:yes stop_codon:yes gene_type:complete
MDRRTINVDKPVRKEEEKKKKRRRKRRRKEDHTKKSTSTLHVRYKEEDNRNTSPQHHRARSTKP